MLPRTLLIAAVVLSAETVRADLVTPDSISPASEGWVTDQYRGLGLVFAPPSLASGVGTYSFFGQNWQSWTAWWQRGPDGTPLGPPVPGVPSGIQSISFVMPGAGTPATTDSIGVRVSSYSDAVFTLRGYDNAGNQIGSRDVFVAGSSDNWLTLRASGMHSFDIISNWPPTPGPGTGPVFNSPNYGIEAIEFHPVPAVPEPGSFALFALGSLFLAGRVGARPKRRVTDAGPRLGG